MAVPKIFAFDAVFTQDASQVRCTLYRRTNTHVLVGIKLLKGKMTVFILSGCGRGLEPGGGKNACLGSEGILTTVEPNSWDF